MQTNDLFGILKGAMIFHAISIPNSELGDNTTIWKHDILFLDEKKVKERFFMSGYLHCITRKTNLSEALRISTLQENSTEL